MNTSTKQTKNLAECGNKSKPLLAVVFSIDDKKPKQGQEIMYKGNLGFSKGTYRNFYKNIGWVILPDGGVDCFDEWCLK